MLDAAGSAHAPGLLSSDVPEPCYTSMRLGDVVNSPLVAHGLRVHARLAGAEVSAWVSCDATYGGRATMRRGAWRRWTCWPVCWLQAPGRCRRGVRRWTTTRHWWSCRRSGWADGRVASACRRAISTSGACAWTA